MKLSAAVISALAAAAIAAPAPASNVAKPGELARRTRANRHARLMHKSRQDQGFEGGYGGGYGGYGGSQGSGSGWGSQGSPTGGAGGSMPTGTSSGSYGQSSGGSGWGSQGSPTGAAGGSKPTGSSSSSYGSSYGSSAVSTSDKASSSSEDDYNESWAGVVTEGDEGSVTGVFASFTLPTVKKPTDGAQVDATQHTTSTWIGIDGYSCGSGLWQAGVDGTIDSSGSVTWYAWYEWYPADTVVVDLGDLATGDVISVNVTASSTTAGTVIMSNAANGKSFTKDVTSTYELCLADAEWIEEDLVIDDSTNEGLANFGSVTFEDAVATTQTGTMSPGSQGTFMDIQDSEGNALTKSSASGNTVTIKYV